MNPFTAAALSGGMLTVAALYLLGFYPQLPPWAMFIAWACFFHLGGGADRGRACRMALTHLGLGIATAWASALIVLHNPFAGGAAESLWAPVAIGGIIGGLLRLGAIQCFSVTPVVIYGYAATFAFLSVTDAFSTDKLLSPSFANALFAIGCSMAAGVAAGYANARIAEWLTPDSLRPRPLQQ